jgi:nucleoside-diphosphate-sugar epimerase
MEIAISGATGFIGEKLVERYIASGDSVRIISRRKYTEINNIDKVKLYNHDITKDDASLSDFFSGIDIFFHCAAEINDQRKMYEVNVLGTKNLLKHAIGRVKRWVQLSSIGVYGNPQFGYINECCTPMPQNLYEKTKLEADNLIIAAGNIHKLNYSIIRPSNVFGVDMRNKSLFQLITMVDKGLFFYIGKRDFRANYIVVDNVVDVLQLSAQNDSAISEVFIVSDSCSMEDFIGYISDGLGKTGPRLRVPVIVARLVAFMLSILPKPPLTQDRINALTNQCYYDISKVKKILNYNNRESIRVGIGKLVNMYLTRYADSR